MKNSWRHFLRRVATVSGATIATAWSSAMCYAVQLAFDSADDPVYVDGWQAGDNGGTGFTAWNFDAGYFFNGTLYAYAHPGFHAIDDGLKAGTHYSNPFNNIGRSWAVGSPADSDGAPRYGRGFPALQIGQTLSVIVDNPTRRQFFKGYFIRLNGSTGGVNGNICNNGHGCTSGATPVNKLTLWRFEYDEPPGIWQIGDGAGDNNSTLFDTQTAEAGMQVDVTLTGVDTYDLTMTPLANPGTAFTQSGNLRNPGSPIDWFEITFFNTFTDTGTPPTTATDFYIRSLQITGSAPAGVPGDYNKNGTVDAADYAVWRDHLGQTFQLDNEVSGVTPGMVTSQDFDAWRARFGNTAGNGAGVTNAAIPEPNTLTFVGTFGFLAFGGRRMRRR